MEKDKEIIAERNLMAFLVASGHQCRFVINQGRVEGSFTSTPELKCAQQAFVQNAEIPVQNFIAAAKQISTLIHRNREDSIVHRG